MRAWVFLSSLAVIGASACVGDSTSNNDGGPNDATTNDVALDANDAAPNDAPFSDGNDGAVATTYNDVTTLAHWEAYTLTDSGAFGTTASGFGSKVFDPKGNAVYFLPAGIGSLAYGNGIAFRYDTTQTFTTKASWTTFDLKTVDNSGSVGCANGLYDGRYLYALPFSDHRAARYDTTGTFTDSSAWTTYDFGTLYNGYIGGSGFDGQYVYTAPYSTTPTVVRYDSKSAFGTGTSWTSFGLAGVSSGAINLADVGYDGRYAYFVRGDGSVMTQYDTHSAFAQNSSWATFDVATVNAGVTKFRGAIFDGRYMNFPPQGKMAARYDTTKPFNQSGSWDVLDLTTVNSKALGFGGGTFDGRYVYFVPSISSGAVLVRFDSTGSFTDKNAWQSIDLTLVTPNVGAYLGAAFDGSHVYLVPEATLAGAVLTNVTVVRFYAKTPPSLPAFTPAFL